MASNAIQIAAALCRRFEGFRSRPYLCPAGVATIGLGSTVYENGVRVTLNDAPITEARAVELLMWQLENTFAPAVRALCGDNLTEGQAAALIDFAYNLGAGKLKASTVRRCVLAGDWGSARKELAKWVNGGGKRLNGLVLRRTAEIALISCV